ncbi:hypothetical protein ACWDY7_33075 [Streptomyces calvus]|uniref:Uncharacterized protein n=1 Tax=Streptomyces calvus TaxID=67282 RepID=A0AA40SKN2_9ACTN|nr:hypothetical protein [Streptomyces calvus]MBA8948251.1 hypothetical protein [Streptomyces calvus]GGP84401.1 hypothetical protein GCM10010247_67130 [Streptomyces calvus]
MGKKPIIAASVANIDSAPSDTITMNGRFGMPHALVIIAVIITAAVLAPDGMSVQDVLWLLAGAGGIGAAVVALAASGGHGGGRLGRLIRAYFHTGN